MCALARRGAAGLAVAVVTAAIAAAPAPADHVVSEREIDVTELHLGLTPGGWIGVYLAFTPRRPRGLTTAGVAIGTRPRAVHGFYRGGRGLSSPLSDPFPNASALRAGRTYRVSISFCRSSAPSGPLGAPAPGSGLSGPAYGDAPVARAAKQPCVTRSFITTRAFLHRRFAPPAR